MPKSIESQADYTLTLSDERSGNVFKLPVIKGTLGPSVIDVRQLYSET
ncbi:uncharacterized protein METZ01_LOCUS399411, partial [marine metagenome]